MGCNNCNERASTRHNAPQARVAGNSEAQIPAGSFFPTPPKNVAEQQISPGKSFSNSTAQQPPAPQQADPFAAFLEAQSLSYEEIMTRQQERVQFAKEQSELAISQMSESMRRVYVELLVDVANGDLMSMGAMTPEQAIIGLKQLLDREDFNLVRKMHPELQVQVEDRYLEIMKKRIVINKDNP